MDQPLPKLPDGLVIEEHVIYESGLHGGTRLRLGLLLADAGRLERWTVALATRLGPSRPEIVVGPALGGAIVGQRVAAALAVSFIPSELVSPVGAAVRYELPEELHDQVTGRRVAIVDDAINAGSAVVATGHRVQELGGKIASVGAVVVREPVPSIEIGGQSSDVVYLFAVPWTTWKAPECPICGAIP